MMSPSVYSVEGGRYATAFTKLEDCEEMVLSYVGGLSESRFHILTVPSLDADIRALGEGKATPLTYNKSYQQPVKMWW